MAPATTPIKVKGSVTEKPKRGFVLTDQITELTDADCEHCEEIADLIYDLFD